MGVFGTPLRTILCSSPDAAPGGGIVTVVRAEAIALGPKMVMFFCFSLICSRLRCVWTDIMRRSPDNQSLTDEILLPGTRYRNGANIWKGGGRAVYVFGGGRVGGGKYIMMTSSPPTSRTLRFVSHYR